MSLILLFLRKKTHTLTFQKSVSQLLQNIFYHIERKIFAKNLSTTHQLFSLKKSKKDIKPIDF